MRRSASSRPSAKFQRSGVISLPVSSNQPVSGTPCSVFALAVRKRVLRKVERDNLASMQRRVKSISARPASLRVRLQSNQELSLSWQYGLLFPCCVRPNSSPPKSIGVPFENISVMIIARLIFSRTASTLASSVGPSMPQLLLRLSLLPSRLSSRLASLYLRV